MKKFFTRNEIQTILESNKLNAQVSYADREDALSPDNYILYYRLSPNKRIYSDDKIHMRKVLIEVIHYHKQKLDSIEDLILSNFNVEPIAFNLKQMSTDYLATYFRFEVFTGGAW